MNQDLPGRGSAIPEPTPTPFSKPESAPAALDAATRERLDRIGENFVIVLSRTGDVVNIATSLRAMINMGFRRLRLVAPDEFSAYRVAGIAHGAEPIIERIEFYDTLKDALADTSMVIGTTARRRTASYVWGHPRERAPDLLQRASTPERPVAIVFGREDTGMLNEELDLCDLLLVVPTDETHSSLNLAQAVLLICYELRMTLIDGATPDLPLPKRKAGSPEWSELQRAFADWERALDTIEFFKSRNAHMIMRSLRALLRRANPNEREVKLLRAIGIEIRKYFERTGGRGGAAAGGGSRAETQPEG
jgi:TrmH family RNA methyltransferase